MFGLGTTELVIILVIVVMLFGLGKLPQAAKQLGWGVRSFQKGLKGDDEDEEEEDEPKQLEPSEEPAAAVEVDEVEQKQSEAW